MVRSPWLRSDKAGACATTSDAWTLVGHRARWSAPRSSDLDRIAQMTQFPSWCKPTGRPWTQLEAMIPERTHVCNSGFGGPSEGTGSFRSFACAVSNALYTAAGPGRSAARALRPPKGQWGGRNGTT